MTEIINDLARVAEQADNAAERVYRLREEWSGDFKTDMTAPMPNRKAHEMLVKIRRGAALISQAVSPEGLTLPNGEVFRVSLEPPSFLSATAREEQAWMAGQLSFPPVEQEGGR